MTTKKTSKPKVATKVKFAYYISNNGDGSASVLFFPALKEADKYASKQNERFDESGDTGTKELQFDQKGKLLNGFADDDE